MVGRGYEIGFRILEVKTFKRRIMKKIKIIGLIITLVLINIGCEELPDPAGERGIAVIPGISDLDPGIFDSKDLEHAYIEFQVSVPEGVNVDKIVIEGSYQDSLARINIVELASFPATVSISVAEVALEMGIDLADISNGDIFLFELVTTANGITTRSSAVLSIPVACAYDVNLATGSYHSVSTDWNSEGDITLTPDPDDPYRILVTGIEEIEGLVEDLGPLVMIINPATYEVSVPEKAISSDAWGFGTISYEGEGVFSSCDGSYSMIFDINVSGLGTYTANAFTFTRNP
jgi:hypothetical protein